MPGPIPKRSDERTRRNKPENEGGVPLSKGVARGGAPIPANPDWVPIVLQWYEAIADSGIADYYERSDWATAYIIAEELNAYYVAANQVGGKRSSMMLQTLMSAMLSLGVTEGDRRRMRIELEKPELPETPASVTAIKDYKKTLGAS